jgi:choline dehydrogenase
VEQRPNLTVWTHALACRVVVEGGRAVGVVCERNGREQRVGADVEVVLSCGAVNTPQLLLLSGIGPADRLRALDLPLAADLPGVGGNLQDHLGIFTYHRTVESFSDFAASPQDTGLAFVSTRPDEPQADLEILFAPVYFPSGQPDSPPPAGSGFTIVVSLQRPESRGHLELRSADPHDRVAIHASYLSEDHDLRVLIEGVRIARRLSESSALSPVVRRAEVPGLVRDREIAELIRAHAATLFHPAGTCKMGHDDHAVVDEELRVHALEGLRVVDASIMPTVPGGHINAPTIAIAEKGADLIIASRAR